MSTKKPVTNKKQSVALKDLKTRKNPKGGLFGSDACKDTSIKAPRKPGITAQDDWETPVA